MLELISVVALAAIGVAFTSYQGDRESTSVARRSSVQDTEDQAEPVGIFGHDVGRRLRDSMRFWNRSEEDQQALDEAEALAARLSASLSRMRPPRMWRGLRRTRRRRTPTGPVRGSRMSCISRAGIMMSPTVRSTRCWRPSRT